MPERLRLSRLPPAPYVLAAAMAVGAAVLLWQTRGQTLLYDEWSFFADYRGLSPSVLLNPFGDNLEVLPLLLYKALFALFGPDSVAYRLVLVGLDLLCAGLFFVLARPRVGDWIALAAAVLLIFLGAAGDVVGASLGIAILLSVACGLGALLALERQDRRGDILACALLIGGLASNSTAIAFLAGAAVDVLVGGRPRRRVWVVAVPALLYGAWRLWALHLDPLGPLAAHPSEVTLTNIGNLPASVAESLAAATVTVTGLFRVPGAGGVSFSDSLGPPLAVALLVIVGLRLRRAPAPSPRVLVFVAMPLVYWVLIALVVSDRMPDLSRYQYPGAIFLMLLLAELAAGRRLPRWGSAAVLAVLGVALLPNLWNLHETARFLRFNGELNRAELAAIEIARARVDPDRLVEPPGGTFVPTSPSLYRGGPIEPTTDAVIAAGRYLSAADDFGSAAFTVPQLADASEDARAAADRELVEALEIRPRLLAVPPRRLGPRRLRIESAPGVALQRVGLCAGVAAGQGVWRVRLQLRPGALAIGAAPGASVDVALSRFADRHAVALRPVPGGSTALVSIPPDGAARPWRARIHGRQGALFCPVIP